MHPLLALAGLFLLQAAPAAASEPPAALLGQRLDAMKEEGLLPLIDLSSTFHPLAMNPEPLAERLGELGVALMGVSCEEGLGRSSEPCAGLADAARLPAFTLLPTGGLPHHGLIAGGQDPEPVFKEVSEGLRTGPPVLGPVSFFMKPARLPKYDRTPPSEPDAAALRRVLALCAENKAVFQVVGPATGRFLADLERLLEENPGVRFVWARDSWGDIPDEAGPHDADYSRGLLDRHPNLYLDLSYRGKNRGGPGDAADPILDAGGRLRPGWKRLIEEKPWRFLSALGLSSRTIARLTWAVSRQRAILSQLEPRARPIVAHQAAWKLLSRQAASLRAEARRRVVESLRGRGETPLIDLSSTFTSLVFNPELLAERLEELGVALMGVSCWVWPASGPFCAELLPGGAGSRFVPLTNGNLPQAASFMGRSPEAGDWGLFVEEARRGGKVLGPLQFLMRPFAPQGQGPASSPRSPDLELLERVADLCAREGLALQLVADPDERFLPVLEDILTRHPGGRVIWSRACERTVAPQDVQRETEQARGLLERFPNLYLDLAYRGIERGGAGGSMDPVLSAGGGLYPAWKRLINDKPERFLSALGLTPRTISRLPGMVERQRSLLRQLDRGARPAVAYQTAWKLLFDESF